MGGNGGALSGVTLVWPPSAGRERRAWDLGGAGVSCPCPGAPALGSLFACSQPEATGTCEQSPCRRMGPTVPRPSPPCGICPIRKDSKFGSQHSLERTTGCGTQHMISDHEPWGIQNMEPSTSAGPWL